VYPNFVIPGCGLSSGIGVGKERIRSFHDLETCRNQVTILHESALVFDRLWQVEGRDEVVALHHDLVIDVASPTTFTSSE
jgi:hypothetical protein